MKRTLFILIFGVLFSTSLVFADPKEPNGDRRALCVQACGTPSSTVIKIKNSNKPNSPSKSIHVDCKCGDNAFNPINGATCRDGQILTEFDRYCLDSKGKILNEKVPPQSNQNTQSGIKVFRLHKCMCGDNAIEKPSLTTMCENGNIVMKEHSPEPSCHDNNK